MRPLATAIAILLLAACPGLEPSDPAADTTPDSAPETSPLPTAPLPAPVALTGTWQVTSQFEVPATVLAPGPLGQSLQLLHQLNENPGGALLDMAELAGVPALDTLRLVLPSEVEAELEGWMSGYLKATTVDGVSPHARIVELDDRIRSVLLDWDLQSTLELPASGTGTHAPTALVFSAQGEPIVVPVSVTAPVTAGIDVVATVNVPAGGEPTVTLGDHFMGVPFGRYAMLGVDAVLAREWGAAGIYEALDAIVDCAALGRSVAAECVDVEFIEVCVGHAALLEEVCEAGVATAASQLEERILGIDFKAIHFESGEASLQGGTVAAATALTDGTWTATIDLGQTEEPEEATATFGAVRGTP